MKNEDLEPYCIVCSHSFLDFAGIIKVSISEEEIKFKNVISFHVQIDLYSILIFVVVLKNQKFLKESLRKLE